MKGYRASSPDDVFITSDEFKQLLSWAIDEPLMRVYLDVTPILLLDHASLDTIEFCKREKARRTGHRGVWIVPAIDLKTHRGGGLFDKITVPQCRRDLEQLSGVYFWGPIELTYENSLVVNGVQRAKMGCFSGSHKSALKLLIAKTDKKLAEFLAPNVVAGLKAFGRPLAPVTHGALAMAMNGVKLKAQEEAKNGYAVWNTKDRELYVDAFTPEPDPYWS